MVPFMDLLMWAGTSPLVVAARQEAASIMTLPLDQSDLVVNKLATADVTYFRVTE